ncbi:hypothetical protein ARMSODRAFT_1027030 [Armillaria solidipes]|uniref:Uncharacterized protein n=1 Tax=Armillaria solidipes TaxID=1076256 RepID=A0A2H3AT44_9AGAR|nr:hypothetical protein ARMSODRAFT_1027030 [Armillaria solidipes]
MRKRHETEYYGTTTFSPIIAIHTLYDASLTPSLSSPPSSTSSNPAKRQKDSAGGIAGGRTEYQPQTPTRRRTAGSAPSRLPLGSLIIIQAHQKEKKKKQSNQPSGPTAPKENDIFSMDDPSPPPPLDTPKLSPAFVFPSDEDDPRLQSTVSANDAPHHNSPEFVPHGPRQEKQVACLQPNLGNFEGSVFHRDDLLENLHPSQLEAVSKNLPGTVLGVLFNGGKKLNDVSRPKPWEALNSTFIPLLGNNESFKAYQGLPETITEDKLAPPYIVVIELTGEIRDVLLRQRILALDDNLALHVVPANCEVLSWAVWLFKANEPIITGSAEEIAKIGNRLRFIILQDLWADAVFRRMIYQVARNRSDPVNTVILNALVDSFVEYRGARDSKYWVFFMKPPSSTITTQEWNSLRNHIRKKTVKNGNINITPALARSGNQYCTICKLDTHPTFDCSFTRDNAVFQGPTKALVGGQYGEQQGSGSHGGGRGNRGRGGRPGRNGRAGRYTRGGRTRY